MTEQRTPAQPIPEAVKELIAKRHAYKEGVLFLTIKGDDWTMNITTTDAEMLTRIHEIAAAMEAVK